MPVRSLIRRASHSLSRQSNKEVVVSGAAALREVSTSESYPGPVRLRVRGVAALRELAVMGPAPQTRDLRVVLTRWEAPAPRWRGRAGAIRHLKSITVDYQPGRRSASAHVVLHEPIAVSEIVNALIPAFAPDAPFAGAGFPLLAVDDSAGEAALALLPTMSVPPLQPIAPALAGKHLRQSDVLLTDAIEPSRDAEATVQQLTVTEAIVGHPRVPSGVIDLQVHNPIGRILGFQPSPVPRRLRFDEIEGVVVVEPSGAASREYREAFPDRPVPEPIRFDPNTPLTAEVVAHMRHVEALDLSSLGDAAELPLGVAARLPELAATGVILHSLPERISLPVEAVTDEVAELVRQPYKLTKGLERERRSVALRRAAMHGHAGFLRLASSITYRTGFRYLPRVSVVLSTMRPELVPAVVTAMAAQNYPEVEVVIVAHGVPAPDLAGVDTSGIDVHIIEVPSSVPFGGALAEGVRRSTGDLITKLDDDDWYSEHHVFDLVLASLYSRADLVGKTTEFLYFDEVDHTVHRTFATERYHDQVAGGAMMLSRAALDATGGWRPTPNSTDRSVLIRIETLGGISYRTHGLGYMYIRRSAKHTWERTDSQLLGGSFEQWRGWRTPEV